MLEYGYKPGLVVEITANSTAQSQSSLNIQSPSTSFNGNGFFYKNDVDDHICPLLLQITEDSLRDDIPIGWLNNKIKECFSKT